jgi:hypothetical protein
VGHTNKPNFSGRLGGFLDSFSALVSIGPLGENRPNAPLRDGDHWYFASKSPEEDDEAGRLDKADVTEQHRPEICEMPCFVAGSSPRSP